MRLVGAAPGGLAISVAALLLNPAAAATAASAQAVSTAQLASNEILLELAVKGRSSAAADQAVLTVQLHGRGASAAAAEADAERQEVALRQALLRVGIAARDVGSPELGLARMSFLSEPRATNAIELPGDGQELETHRRNRLLAVTIRDLARRVEVRRALADAGVQNVSATEFKLADDSGPRRIARAQALARARTAAEDHAAALGMRVARVVRVSERSLGGTETVQAYQAMLAMFGAGGSEDREVAVNVDLAVDFALAPR